MNTIRQSASCREYSPAPTKPTTEIPGLPGLPGARRHLLSAPKGVDWVAEEDVLLSDAEEVRAGRRGVQEAQEGRGVLLLLLDLRRGLLRHEPHHCSLDRCLLLFVAMTADESTLESDSVELGCLLGVIEGSADELVPEGDGVEHL